MKRGRIWKVVGINFDHFHMGDLLRFAHAHPQAEVVGIADEQPARLKDATKALRLGRHQLFSDFRTCLVTTKPDIVILCPSTSQHGAWVKKVAPFGVHIMVEKPFAASVREADAMVAAMPKEKRLMINWPTQWSGSVRKAQQLIATGVIGDVLNVWHFGGNRGPLWHGAAKKIMTAEQVAREKPNSWFYKKATGGGSLLDYLGYGATIGSWFQSGRRPIEVTAVTDSSPGIEVDEHAVVVLRYAHGLAKLETRWGTFTDPWTVQPQPRCGFVVAGTEGTVSAYDYDAFVTLQTRKRPRPHRVSAPKPTAPHQPDSLPWEEPTAGRPRQHRHQPLGTGNR